MHGIQIELWSSCFNHLATTAGLTRPIIPHKTFFRKKSVKLKFYDERADYENFVAKMSSLCLSFFTNKIHSLSFLVEKSQFNLKIFFYSFNAILEKKETQIFFCKKSAKKSRFHWTWNIFSFFLNFLIFSSKIFANVPIEQDHKSKNKL